MEDKKQTINFDEMGMSESQPRFKEEVRRDKNGEVTAYVLKRNPKK